MRIKNIEVLNLFGVFDYSIPINLAERITIIHGPNGYGKTALLSLTQTLLGNHFAKLRRIPFQRFALQLEDGTQLSVSKNPTLKPISEKPQRPTPLHFELNTASANALTFDLDVGLNREAMRFPVEMIQRSIPNMQQIGPELWLNTQTGVQLDLDDIAELYPDFIAGISPSIAKPIPDWLSHFKQFDVRLIEAQRLWNIPTNRFYRHMHPSMQFTFEPAVTLYSNELAAIIQQIQAQYGAASQQLDSTFPKRVLQAATNAAPDTGTLKTRLQDLETKRQRIIDAGLLTKERYGPTFDTQATAADQSTKNILSLYSEDVEKKLSVFDEITAKVELLKELVNKRFKYKQLQLEGQTGLRLRTSAGQSLLPTDLSSGEQHELVLLYELLFKTKPNALILIDEPELSLHVAWQVEFLTDLARVIKLSSFDVILATHSPQIINNRWELAVELKGPKD